MKLGADVFVEEHLDLVRNKRVGLITNPTGVDAKLVSVIERFLAHPEVKLVALYGPEHGVRGNAQAGEFVDYYEDEHLRLPVFSLYGQSLQPFANGLQGIDARMRSFDTTSDGKAVKAEMLGEVDVLLFDTQDIGTRVYTYLATMAYAMQGAAQRGIPFVVLDRPNPINGSSMEGPVLEYPKQSSFIGVYPIPLRHGMTLGELARLFNERFLPEKADLTVVRMEGWNRADWFDDSEIPWVLPSPNMPTVDTATVYPGQVILEGTNLSEGRGTTKPFELFGAPWVDGYILARELNALELPGARFREVWFTPTFSKFAGITCGGCQLHVIDREAFRPVTSTLAILEIVKRFYGTKFEFHSDYFDKVLGTSSVRASLEKGTPFQEIVTGFSTGLAEFAKERGPFLLY